MYTPVVSFSRTQSYVHPTLCPTFVAHSLSPPRLLSPSALPPGVLQLPALDTLLERPDPQRPEALRPDPGLHRPCHGYDECQPGAVDYKLNANIDSMPQLDSQSAHTHACMHPSLALPAEEKKT